MPARSSGPRQPLPPPCLCLICQGQSQDDPSNLSVASSRAQLPLASMDAFVSVGEAVAGAASKQEQLAAMVERLPVLGPDDTTSPSCHNSRLLMMKANSAALVTSLQASLDLLHQVREQQIWSPANI